MDFLDDLLGGLQLFAFSVVAGGVVWGLFVLRVSRLPLGTTEGTAAVLCVRLIIAAAIGLALAQASTLVLKIYILAATTGVWPLPMFLDTQTFRAGLARTLLASAVALAAMWLVRRPVLTIRWAIVAVLVLATAVNAAWLTHAASRFEERIPLMVLTTVHMSAAAVWVGGVVQLVAFWHLARRRPEQSEPWPSVLGRFSATGLVSVAVLAATAVPLGLFYVSTWEGLVGTGYGAIVVTKTVLFGVTLGLAALNFRAGQEWRKHGNAAVARTRSPHLVEAELLVLLTLLFAAASLSAQPPTRDVAGARATWSEVVKVFEPKPPRLISPSIEQMPGAKPSPLSVVPGQRTVGDDWSEFNHNVSGLILVAIAVLSFAARFRGFRWCRHWPLGFMALAGVLFVRSDPEAWPSGPIGFFDSLRDAEVLQHWLAALLAFVLGFLEWRARTVWSTAPRLPYVFPVLSALGGILLLTHSHTAFELKSQFLIELSHSAMGLIAVLVAGARWLELRLEPPAGRWAGLGASWGLLLIGLILSFYRETLS